jgi:tetratricopeptide (TPR) repeat protein
VVAYELLSGRRPFENDSITAEAAAHVHEEVPLISAARPGLPQELEAVFGRALAKDPSERYETAAELVAALRAAFAEAAGATRTFTAATPVRAEPARRPRGGPGQWMVLGGLLALAAIGGAIAAIVLTDGGSAPKATKRPAARTVTTVVTRQGQATTVTAPASTGSPGSGSGSGSLSGLQLNNAGYTKMLAGDYAGALPLLSQAVAKLSGVGYPTEAYANYNLGYTLLQLGRCDEAIPYLEQAKGLEPQRHEPKDALKRAKHCQPD